MVTETTEPGSQSFWRNRFVFLTGVLLMLLVMGSVMAPQVVSVFFKPMEPEVLEAKTSFVLQLLLNFRASDALVKRPGRPWGLPGTLGGQSLKVALWGADEIATEGQRN